MAWGWISERFTMD